ncbi:MAG: hypothetical protein ABL997_03600 [Planctomycetota bacterium]
MNGMHSATQRSVALALLAAVLGAQQPEQPSPPQQPQGRVDFEEVAESFLASDQSDAAKKERAVSAILDAADRALPWLGERMRAIPEGDQGPRSKGIRALVVDVILGFVDRKSRSGVVYRGQYAALEALQPMASELLFEWLLRTPFWLPDTQRKTFVPAIADLQPSPPVPERLLAVTDIVENIEGESDDLRFSLSCLAWQWGRKQYIEARAAQLQKDSAEGDAEDRILAFRELSNVWYRVQEYRRAASTHAAMTTIAERSKYDLLPTDWYWGACYNALSARIDAAFVALERCADLHASPDVDPVRKLPRQLFETDPELNALRADPRFPALLLRAFPPKNDVEKGR